MDATLDMARIARELGAVRRGKVAAGGGYFGALQLAAEVASSFQVAEESGTPLDPSSSEQHLIQVEN